MRSPADMQIIQIDITNACIHNCSNCTRFCGLHRKPFFMDFATFKKAVDSLAGYRGIVGVMGGRADSASEICGIHGVLPRPRSGAASAYLLSSSAAGLRRLGGPFDLSAWTASRYLEFSRQRVLPAL